MGIGNGLWEGGSGCWKEWGLGMDGGVMRWMLAGGERRSIEE
jgi:hypothetical protein